MSRQTALDWFFWEINKRGPKENNPPQWVKELYLQAKQIEKEQIVEAHGIKESHGAEGSRNFWQQTTGEQYYNETYGKTKN